MTFTVIEVAQLYGPFYALVGGNCCIVLTSTLIFDALWSLGKSEFITQQLYITLVTGCEKEGS